jgi:hypothetical protein
VVSQPSVSQPAADPIPAPAQPVVAQAPKPAVEQTIKVSDPEPLRVEEPQTTISQSDVAVEKPVAQTTEITPEPQKPIVKLPENPPAAEHVHDVPVQSHHVSSFSIKSVMKADELANSVKTEVKKDRTEDFTPDQINEEILMLN